MWNRIHGIGMRFVFCWSIALIYHTNAQCTSTDAGTCYIHRSSAWTPSDSHWLQCDGQLKKCVVTCAGDDLSCSSGDLATQPIYVVCPVNAVSCIINCQSTKSCQGITIMATTSDYTEINIVATDAGKGMTIHSPGSNGGYLSINLESTDADFYGSTIIAQQNASVIDIDCDIGNLCSNNTIQGQRVEGDTASITLSCNGEYSADCSHTNLYCSHDALITSSQASCSIDCELCKNTNVYTVNGILDTLDWNCANPSSCTGSQLYCGEDQTDDFSNLIYDSIHTQWAYQPGIGVCGFLTTTPTSASTVSPTSVPSIGSTILTSTNINAAIITSTRVIQGNRDTSGNGSSVFTSMDPLYYVIFMLALALGCVVCILIFWVYHQRKFSKDLDEEDGDGKARHRNVHITSNGSILPLSPHILALSTASRSNLSSPIQYDAVSTVSGSNLSRGNTNTTNTTRSTPHSPDQDSVILEANTIFNPHHTKRIARSTMDSASERIAFKLQNSNSSPSGSPSPPVPKAYNDRITSRSTPNGFNAQNTNVNPQSYAAKSPSPQQAINNVYLSPISALSGVRSDVYTCTCTTDATTASTITPRDRKTTASTEEESDSESDESEESESYTTSESASTSEESENTIHNVVNYATQKSKFALPAQYKNMSISTSRNNDQISMNQQHRNARHLRGKPPQMPIASPPPAQLHRIPYKATKQTLPIPVPNKHRHKHKKHKKKHKHRHKHKKKRSRDKIKFGAKTHNMNLSMTSGLTELTEGTEHTEYDTEMTQTTHTEHSYSSQDTDGLSTIASSEYTDSCSSSDVGTEFTQSGPDSSESDVNTAQDNSNTNTYHDEDGNETYREQSKTIHSRITHDGTMKEITIKSEVLDADIVATLYDNKIKPLGLSGMIDALKEECDDSSPSPPSPQNVMV